MKRLICQQCKRPASVCICRWITPIQSSIQVLILQHPLEVDNAKGSAKLLELSLTQCRVVVGEQFDSTTLHALLREPWPDATFKGPVEPLLLYPSDSTFKTGVTTTPMRLIVLDATWRKSRKMLFLNPQLALLPRFALTNPEASRYIARKAQRPEQRSTLEASCAALRELEGATGSQYEPLLAAFEGFVDALVTRTARIE
jgi:DTW domain-containing protein